MSDELEDNLTPVFITTKGEGDLLPQMPIGERQGQLFQVNQFFRFVDLGEIPKGYSIVPIQLHSENAHGFAALHLIWRDFEFSHACLQRAHALGRPDHKNIECRAFINTGVMAYARAFSHNVRGVRLTPDMFTPVWNEDDAELHDYLIALRDRHIAHSVNEFERGDPIGVIVMSPEGVRKEDVSGVGAMLLEMIGINMQRLELAVHHVELCMNFIDKRIKEMAPDVHADMKADLPNGWTAAPMLRPTETRSDVRKKRTSFGKLGSVLQRLRQP